MKIEAVTTCVAHADILCHSLPINRQHFDHFVVVTAPEDKATQRVCEAWGVTCKQTDSFLSRWGQFLKGAGINEGLRLLDKDAWIVHLDADIVLPPHFRGTLEAADLDPSMIYGVDRQCFRSWSEWNAFIEDPAPQTEDDLLIHPQNSGRPLGDRIVYPLKGGYVPLGFFQLWNASSGITEYIAKEKTAGRDDANFACQWPRAQRALIPEIIAYHLESEPAPMATNWKGRTTKPFRCES
jgi:Glycosyltransferase like family 2